MASGDPNSPNRFGRRSTSRPGDPGRSYSAITTQYTGRALGHLLNHGLANSPITIQGLRRYTQDLMLYLIRIRDNASDEISGTARHGGHQTGDLASRTTLGRAHCQPFPQQELSQTNLQRFPGLDILILHNFLFQIRSHDLDIQMSKQTTQTRLGENGFPQPASPRVDHKIIRGREISPFQVCPIEQGSLQIATLEQTA